MRKIVTLLVLFVLSAMSFAQDAQQFAQGHYINRKGDKVEGLLKYQRGYKRVEYKATADAKRSTYVTPANCKEFVIDSARFVRTPGPVTVRYGGWNRTVGEDFIQVFAEGKISLYKHYDEEESKTKYDHTPTKVESVIIRKEKGGLVALTDNEEKNREKLEEMFPKERDVVKALMSKDWQETVNFIRAYNAK